MPPSVAVDDRDGVRHVTIDRPPVNALSMAEYDALVAAFRLGDDIRVVVLRGAGRVWSAGQDLAELSGLQGASDLTAYLEQAARGVAAVAACPVPIVAALDGPAVGAGALLVACADLVLATPQGSLAFPEVRHGLRLGRSLLAGVLPEPLLAYAFATGAPLDAERLHAVGLVAELLAPESLAERVQAVVADLMALPIASLSWLRRPLAREQLASQYLQEALAAGDDRPAGEIQSR